MQKPMTPIFSLATRALAFRQSIAPFSFCNAAAGSMGRHQLPGLRRVGRDLPVIHVGSQRDEDLGRETLVTSLM